jgi:cell division initiation protein
MAQLTPLDILQKQFVPARNGYEPEEVQQFLDAVREAWESSLRDAARLRDELRDRDAVIDGLRAEQSEIRETLVLARRVSLDVENAARREADVLVGEARLEAERILAAVHEEHRALQEQVLRLKAARLHHLAQMRALLDAHGRMIEEFDGSE